MDIIDSHTHVDEYEAFGWYDPPEALIELLDEAGIQQAVVMTYADAPVLSADALQYIAGACRRFPDRLIPYARINPHAPEAPALLREAVLDLGMKGLKIHPESITAHPYHPAVVSLVKLAAELGVPSLFHSGDESLSLPLQFGPLAEAAPDATIILAHMGGYAHVDEAIHICETHENLYLDTSACPYPYKVKEAIDRIGSHRVLFASDGPGCNPKHELQKITHLDLPQETLRRVLHDNIAGLLERAPS